MSAESTSATPTINDPDVDKIDVTENSSVDGDDPQPTANLVGNDGDEMPSSEAGNKKETHSIWHTSAVMALNVLQAYDFNMFGLFGDEIGEVFFPPSDNSTFQSFVVFGAAFLIRPFGGAFFGYIGDTYGRKVSVVSGTLLMAISTFVLGCLPGYDQAGNWASFWLLLFRLLQGWAVGGQLMSSMVYTLENHDHSNWGYYGSFLYSSVGLGTVLGSLIVSLLRENLSDDALHDYGWRIPFWIGIIAAIPGIYLYISDEGDRDVKSDEKHQKLLEETDTQPDSDEFKDDEPVTKKVNPLVAAFSWDNLPSLIACCMVPALGSGGFYLTFVWLAVFMEDILDPPVSHAFAINTCSLFFFHCCILPFCGILSDWYGRNGIITIGAVLLGGIAPVMLYAISLGSSTGAFFAQSAMGIGLSLYRAPIGTWLVESFPPEARLTSVSVGYNICSAIVGSTTPALATYLAEDVALYSPGFILTVLATVSLVGMWFVAPSNAKWT